MPSSSARRRELFRWKGLVPLLLVVSLAAPLLLTRLGAGSLEGDEAIYGEVVREAVAGAWMPLRYNTAAFPYPQLRLWLGATVASVAGTGEASLRSVDAVLGLATVLVVLVAGARLFGWVASTLAALLLPTLHNLLLVHGWRSCGLDASLVFLVSAAMLFYGTRRLASIEADGPSGPAAPRTKTTVVGTGLLFGAACWAKFPVPGLGVVALCAWEIAVAPRGARLRGPLLALATGLVALLVYLPSLGLHWAAIGGEYVEFLRWHLLERAAGRVSAGAPSPLYYVEQLWADFGPALAVAAGGAAVGLWRCRRGGGRARSLAFCALWALVFLLFYQAVPARNVWYLYPAYPALALLVCGSAVGGIGALRTRSAATAGVAAALVGIHLLVGLSASWAKVVAPAEKSDPDRIAEFLEAQGRPRLCKTAGTNLEAWEHFYLGPLLTRARVDPRAPGGCEYLLTVDPWSALPVGEEEERVRWLQSFSVDRAPVALVSLREPLPPRARALDGRSEAALWGRVRLIGTSIDGALFSSRHWRARERWPLAGARGSVAGPPTLGADVWHRIEEPYAPARLPFRDAWLPGGQEVALLVSGLDAAPLRLLFAPAPTAEARPQWLRIASRDGRERTYRIPGADSVEIELTLAAGELDGDVVSGEGRLALAVWSSPWVPRRDLPESADPRHLGVRLLAIRQADREIWRLPEVPPGASGRPLAMEEAGVP